MNESAMGARSLTRPIEVEGAMRGTKEMLRGLDVADFMSLEAVRGRRSEAHPFERQISLNLIASSGGRSTMIKPLAPASRESFSAFSSP